VGKAKAKIRERARHIRKLMGGAMSAREVHQKHAFPPGAKCQSCGRRPLLRAITLAPIDEAKRYYPEIEALPSPDLFKILVPLDPGDGKPRPHVRLGVAYACRECGPTMERALAKLPSWVVVDINRGPAQERMFSA